MGIWFQHEGAPALFSNIVHHHFEETLEDNGLKVEDLLRGLLDPQTLHLLTFVCGAE